MTRDGARLIILKQRAIIFVQFCIACTVLFWIFLAASQWSIHTAILSVRDADAKQVVTQREAVVNVLRLGAENLARLVAFADKEEGSHLAFGRQEELENEMHETIRRRLGHAHLKFNQQLEASPIVHAMEEVDRKRVMGVVEAQRRPLMVYRVERFARSMVNRELYVYSGQMDRMRGRTAQNLERNFRAVRRRMLKLHALIQDAAARELTTSTGGAEGGDGSGNGASLDGDDGGRSAAELAGGANSTIPAVAAGRADTEMEAACATAADRALHRLLSRFFGAAAVHARAHPTRLPAAVHARVVALGERLKRLEVDRDQQEREEAMQQLRQVLYGDVSATSVVMSVHKHQYQHQRQGAEGAERFTKADDTTRGHGPLYGAPPYLDGPYELYVARVVRESEFNRHGAAKVVALRRKWRSAWWRDGEGEGEGGKSGASGSDSVPRVPAVLPPPKAGADADAGAGAGLEAASSPWSAVAVAAAAASAGARAARAAGAAGAGGAREQGALRTLRVILAETTAAGPEHVLWRQWLVAASVEANGEHEGLE
jgi:hypothetical protein